MYGRPSKVENYTVTKKLYRTYSSYTQKFTALTVVTKIVEAFAHD